jgi:uncharacterized protein
VTTYLLDVNVLLALFDPSHVSHEAAHGWFETVGHHAWATCPVIENGVVRIASHPSYPSRPGNPREILDLLRRFCATKGHQFWPDTVSLLDESLFQRNVPIGHNHVTDIYLLALAVGQGGKLATFDRKIPAAAVRGGAAGMEIIPP